MKWIAVLMNIFLIAGCKQTAVEQKLSDTDSVLVQFFDENGMIYNAVTSTEQFDIQKLTSFMEGRAVTAAKCGSSGKVQFFSENVLLLDATYLLKTDCRYFSFDLNGKLHHTAMSNEAADFLISLKPPR